MRIHRYLLPLAVAAIASISHADDQLIAGGSVRQSNPVTGDLIGVGGDFDLSAPVQGKAVIGGGNVRVNAPVAGDLFAGGGNVTVSASVGGNARLAGGNVDVESGATIGGDLSVAGGDVGIRGPVTGSIHIGAGNALIDTTVAGDVHAATGELVLGPNARISGKVVHRGANVRRDPAAQVGGGIKRARIESSKERVSAGRNFSGGWIWTLGFVALAAILAAAFPAAARQVGGELRSHPGMSLLFGFVALICIPAASVILMITIIGLPVALIALLLYFVLLLVGYATAGVIIGEFALARLRPEDANHTGWRIGAAVAAMLLLALVAKIPFLGGFIAFVALLAGVGAILMAIGDRRAVKTASA